MIPSLIAITPGTGLLPGWAVDLAAQGVPAVLIREPSASPEDVVRWISDGGSAALTVIVHTRTPGWEAAALVHVAAAGADPGRPHGRSCHDGPSLDAAFAAGARYAFLSPVWAPIGKPNDRRPPLGLPRFLDLAAGRRVLALGGVTRARLDQIRAAGGHGAAYFAARRWAPGT